MTRKLILTCISAACCLMILVGGAQADLNLADGTATGFYVDQIHENALDETIGRALNLRYHHAAKWAQMVETGMSQDWSWSKSAQQYESLYAKTMALKSR